MIKNKKSCIGQTPSSTERISCFTRNFSVDEIGERYRLNYAVVVKLYQPILNFPVTFAHLIGESRLFRPIVNFWIIAPFILLLAEEFLVDSIRDSSINNTYKLKFLFEGLECYKGTQMKAYDIY